MRNLKYIICNISQAGNILSPEFCRIYASKIHSQLESGINMHFFYFLKIIPSVFNTASVQDTANNHTKQMGDFEAPLCFGRVLPPNHRPHSMGVAGPPYGGLRGHITLI